MEIGIFLLTLLILLFESPLAYAEVRCQYMINIPREPRPDDLPELEYEGTTWNEMPFIPATDRDDVCMEKYIPATATRGTQIIYMDEEIEGDVAIAKINYNGTATPAIVRPLVSGTFNMLGPEIRRKNDEWYLYITERQDYETPGMQVYMFNVRIENEVLLGGVTLQIVNIDDNPPIIHVLDSCVIPELDDPGLTNCVYEVSDEDGEISISAMTFRIDSDRDDDQVFYILGETIPSEWNHMTMTLGLRRSLDYEINALHIFRVTAFDSLPNNHTVTLMVQVENVEHRPPRWVEIFAVQQFDEKLEKNFTLRAIDGDTGIDKPIHYTLVTEEGDEEYFNITTLEGGRDGAILQVYSIDRDELEREIFQLSVIAYKYDNRSFETATNVVIIINDVNDQIPEPIFDIYEVAISEETPLTITFDKEFGFHDKDLGKHAQYTVHLESVYPLGAAEAFFIQPEVGYQRQTFIMGTTNHSMLDYEVPEFQHIELKVVAIDMDKPEHVGVATVFIDLINWNDELPIFEHSTKTVRFDETVGKGYQIGRMEALDRDIDDRVEHSIMGNAVNFLYIDKDTGNISVAIDEAFDYHRQNELLVQVRADDTLGEPYNTATSQLVIQLNDINNTPPTLRLPRGSPQVQENVPQGYEIVHNSQEITATDPDTTAELYFNIIWETSYATKQGRETNPLEFHGCLDIETIYPDVARKGSAIGRLVVQEIRYNVTIDYEEFEVLYLTVRVTDNKTEIGQNYDELTFTITIIDMNDNAPIWNVDTLTQDFNVRENSATNTVIGSVQASDIDGPLYNQIRYTIIPRNNTPENLVKIDFISGQISVELDSAIDADIPKRYNLYYTVIASDKCSEVDSKDCPDDITYWDTEDEIAIRIIDTNNKVPMAETDKFNTTVYIYEDAESGDDVVLLASSDLDRDEIYNTVAYQIDYTVNPRLRSFFSVDQNSGRVFVDYTTAEKLDRDGDEPTHQIFFTLIDNFYTEGDGNRNQNSTGVLVVLLDVNDNAPELPTPNELSWTISESLHEGVRVLPEIYAPDRDEPDTDNSRVGYRIVNLTMTNRDLEVPDLFTMIQIQNVTGELETAMDLKGYWGTYELGIRAFDHGIPQQVSEEIYELTITPYNFHDPVFVFPLNGRTIRLSRERAVTNGLLSLVNGEFLDRIEATDEDGLEAGIVTFDVSGDDDAALFFHVENNIENQGTLMLKQLFQENIREFQVTIRATDGGTDPFSRSTETTVYLVFVPTQGEPIFLTNTASVSFVESEVGMTERQPLPLAEDYKNHLCNDYCYDIYYNIISGNDEGFFALDPIENIIFLTRELDRTVSEIYVLRVAASNSADPGTPLASSILTVTVTVREANPRPNFVRDLYTAGISTLDSINKELLTVQAMHTEDATINYTIDQTSMIADPSLSNVRDSAFSLNAHTGVLVLIMQPTASMQGMFQFNVVATDPDGASDTAEVKIYLISSLNRVIFRFVNTIEELEKHRDFIAQTFSTAFTMTCNIDQIVPANDDSGIALDDINEVRAHFIKYDLPVDIEEIEELRSDTQLLLSIQVTLNRENLTLTDFVTGASPIINTDTSLYLVYILAAMSGLLGLLSLVLLIALLVRTRILNRRLQALSMTKYGSQESGLNRAGLAAPGTNKHTVEGSNPIWNETMKAPDFDAISDTSDDSDLIGIENLPQFRHDYFPPADNNSTPDNFKPNQDTTANHNNNFGFNSTPFSPEFANTQLRYK